MSDPHVGPMMTPGDALDPEVRGPWAMAARRFLRNRLAVVCGVVLAGLVAVSLLAPVLQMRDPNEQHIKTEKCLPPSTGHPAGTDTMGRDLLSRLVWGSRISFKVGFVATLVSILLGLTYGALSGYAGGRVDALMMRIVDVLYGLPFMIIVVILMTAFQKKGESANYTLLFIALAALQWLTMARIVRGQVLSLKEREYVEAARALGAPAHRILLRHLIPNLLGPVIVYATLTVPRVMLDEAFLSFLGLGVQPPDASWGVLISKGADTISSEQMTWWLLAFPSACLGLTLFCLNFIGDGLRDALDPQSAR